jgi:hypothetical protein
MILSLYVCSLPAQGWGHRRSKEGGLRLSRSSKRVELELQESRVTRIMYQCEQ